MQASVVFPQHFGRVGLGLGFGVISSAWSCLLFLEVASFHYPMFNLVGVGGQDL